MEVIVFPLIFIIIGSENLVRLVDETLDKSTIRYIYNMVFFSLYTGQSFTRDLLKAIIPKNNVNMIDTTLYNLCKQQFFECGSLVLQSSQGKNHSSSHLMFGKHSSLHILQHQQQQQQQQHHHHHHNHVVQGVHSMQVLCACYAFEGFSVINLSQSNNFVDNKKRVCLYFHFTNTFVQEAAYALWLEDQRKAIYEKAAMHLEKFSDKCRACGGSGFIPGHGRGVTVTHQLKSGSAKRFSGKCKNMKQKGRQIESGVNYTVNVLYSKSCP